MSDDRQQIGRIGEQHAAIYLHALGYRILARNWRCDKGEIDLVAEHEDDLVIIEVRTRRGAHALNQALESITRDKQIRLRQLAQAYRHLENVGLSGLRVDVVVVALMDETVEIEVYPNAIGE